MDAGPGLNFFSVNQERLLFSVLGRLRIPETVRDEMLRKARTDARFQQSESVLRKVPERLLEVLSDDATGPLTRHVERISGSTYPAAFGAGERSRRNDGGCARGTAREIRQRCDRLGG